jgi:hypothetical protein
VIKAKIETYGETGRRSIDIVINTAEKIYNLNEEIPLYLLQIRLTLRFNC